MIRLFVCIHCEDCAEAESLPDDWGTLDGDPVCPECRAWAGLDDDRDYLGVFKAHRELAWDRRNAGY